MAITSSLVLILNGSKFQRLNSMALILKNEVNKNQKEFLSLTKIIKEKRSIEYLLVKLLNYN